MLLMLSNNEYSYELIHEFLLVSLKQLSFTFEVHSIILYKVFWVGITVNLFQSVLL